MIGVFPELLPDELLYSGLARYQVMLGYTPKSLRLEVFGADTVTAVIDLPGHLDALVARLPPGHPYPVTRLIAEHTMLPYYAPFLPPARVAAAVAAMRAGGRGVHRIVTAAVPPPARAAALRFCAHCVREDQARSGWAYWHRVQQAPGVLLCPHHGEVLHESPFAHRYRADRDDYHALSDDLLARGRALPLDPGATRPLQRIARDTRWLLEHPDASPDLDALHACYRSRVRQAGWGHGAGAIQVSGLEAALLRHYGAALLEAVGAPLGGAPAGRSWVALLLQQAHASHPPLHHLLLIQFLGCTVADLLTAGAGHQPAPAAFTTPGPGDGPAVPRGPGEIVLAAPCRNRCCLAFDAAAFAALRAPAGAPRLVTVRCPTCLFTYAFASTCPRLQAIRHIGPLWESELRRLAADPTRSRTQIAAQLGVGVATVVRYATQLGLPPPGRATPARNSRTPAVLLAEREARRQKHRALLLRLRTEQPDLGRVALHRRLPVSYEWLRARDRPWLEEQLPRPRYPFLQAERRNWAARDAELASRVQEAARALHAAPGRPTRITVKAVEVQLGRPDFLRPRLGKLPQTRVALRAVVESKAQGGARRLHWAADAFAREEVVPSPHALARRAGFSSIDAAQAAGDLEALRERIRRALP